MADFTDRQFHVANIRRGLAILAGAVAFVGALVGGRPALAVATAIFLIVAIPLASWASRIRHTLRR